MNIKRFVQKHAYLLEVLGILIVMTILGVAFRDSLGLVNLALLHLIPILLIAVSGNVRLTMVIAILCIVIFNFLYIPPLYTFKIYDYAHIWSLFIFILFGYVIARQAKNLQLKYRESQMREVLLDIVSHDLKTPLSSIYGSASLLVDEKKLPKETQEHLYREILKTSIGMKKLITNLLDNSRLKDGTAKPNLEWCDFNDIIVVAIEELSLEYDTDFIDIKIAYPYLFWGDNALLVRLFFNLLDNALKYSNEGEHIVCKVDEAEDGVKIVIINSCKSQCEQKVDRMFERFYRHKEDQDISGAGLGLAICRNIVKIHHGKINASWENETLSIEVLLPVSQKVVIV